MAKYNVIVKEMGDLYPLQAREAKTEKEARSTAKKLAEQHPDKQVFIEFFRPSDGQNGYINRNGFSLIGESWTN